MANRYLAVRDGGKTGEEGAMRLFSKLAGTQNEGRVSSDDLAVAQNGTPNMSVNVGVGDIIIPYTTYIYHGWIDATQNKTITAADPTNPRIDRVVAYVDRAILGTTNSNNPDALVLAVVAGTPAGSPVRPNDAAVETAVGAGNPYTDLADVRVEAAVTTIVTAKITDTRSLFILGGGIGGILLPQNGVASVSNDVAPLIVVPKSGSFTALYARCKTAPTGAALTGRVNKNGVQVATFSIAAGAFNTSSTGLSIAYSAGDYFTLDITQVGSGVAGANVSVVLG